jgi:hypothetical protein
VFALDAVSFVVSAPVLLRLPAVPPQPRAAAGEPALAVLRDRTYAVVAALNMVLQLHIPLITLGIPLWIVRRTHAPGWTVAMLLVLNTMSVVVFQVRVARRVRDLATAARQVRAAGVVLLVACVVFALSAAGSSAVLAVTILMLAAALQSLAEMMQANSCSAGCSSRRGRRSSRRCVPPAPGHFSVTENRTMHNAQQRGSAELTNSLGSLDSQPERREASWRRTRRRSRQRSRQRNQRRRHR